MFGQGLNFGGLTGSAPFDAYYLVVAGGGSGGSNSNSGGAGAGGYRTNYGSTALEILPSTTYNITVGAGGTATTFGSGVNGNNGNNSVFNIITSTGGGAGGAQGQTPGTGGSGGGGGYDRSGSAGNAGGFSPVEGYAGGSGTQSGSYPGGGGGGASEVGNTDGAGHGGDGTSNSITGSAVFYAGGGSAGLSYGYPVIPGSNGGGGTGGAGDPSTGGTAATAGIFNTGGGGGGGSAGTGGGAGGSGTVILRYPTAKVSSYAVTGTLDTVTNGNYPIANKACYTLNGNVLDISGNGYNGTNYNVNFSTGRYGQAGSFNGSSSYVDTGISGTTVAWGYSAWFKTSVASGCVLAQLNGSGSSSGVDIIVQSGGQLRCLFHQNGNPISSNFLFGSGLNDGNWHHVAYTWDGVNGNNATITIDGRTYNQTAQISGGTNADATLKIGRLGSPSGGGYFNGLLNQVRVFSSKLSASQISSLYNEGYVRETTNSNDSILQFTGGSGDITFS